MSITIDWPSLTTGPSGLALADSIRDFIHDKFQQVTLPRFIRSVHVHSFDFGEECPVVELKDISDPLPEFYEDGDDEDEDSTEDVEGEGEGEEAVGGAIEETTAPKQTPHRPNGTPTTSTTAVKPSSINTRLPHPTLRTGLAFPPPEQISTPFLSRSTTPGIPIPGGTSNFGYFHLPLSAGLSGTQTPLPWGEHHQHQPSSPLRREEQSHPAPFFPSSSSSSSAYADPTSRPTTRDSTTRHHRHSPSQEPHTTAANKAREEDRSQDVQTTLHISYSGTLSLSLTAEILLDYPMPSFVGIPLKLQITGLSFDGVALLAYLRHHAAAADGAEERRKVHFCFLGREDARAMVGDEMGGERGDGEREEDEEGLGGLLREIRVESEIGRKEDGKQVLKNVGKVEKFVLEQVRRIFEDEFVWPSFWTFLV